MDVVISISTVDGKIIRSAAAQHSAVMDQHGANYESLLSTEIKVYARNINAEGKLLLAMMWITLKQNRKGEQTHQAT